MNEHQDVRDELRALPEPKVPLPPPDLADTVLGRLGRQRKVMRAGIAALVLVLLAAVPVVWAQGGTDGLPPADPTTSEAPDMPKPGGGPSAIHVYGVDGESFVLDPATGAYQGFPFEVVLSPDLRWAAILDDGKVGVVSRASLLRAGDAEVTWLDMPPADGPTWSPNGKTLLVTATDRTTALRYDPDKPGSQSLFPVPLREMGAPLSWAGDSQRYLGLLTKQGTPGGMVYLTAENLDTGSVEGAPGQVGGYSPDGRYGFLHALPGLRSTVFYTKNGVLAMTVPQSGAFAGWYDDTTVALVDEDEPALALFDVAASKNARSIPLPGVPDRIQIGPSAELTGEAARYGF